MESSLIGTTPIDRRIKLRKVVEGIPDLQRSRFVDDKPDRTFVLCWLMMTTERLNEGSGLKGSEISKEPT